jgi:DNA (cytosine-5)-methyltransferase 1
MRFISLFSGIGGAEVALLPLGWECAAVCEVDPFASAALKHHYPDIPNLGDITKVTKQDIEALGHVDVVIGGFPCQSVSLAGKREGLIHDNGELTRSGLFYVAERIFRWSRARFFILENVPGLYSSKGGRDFAGLVGVLVGADVGVPAKGWKTAGVAVGPDGFLEFRCYNGEYFGVAQRRRRVFLVLDTGDWTSRPPILLVPESLSGYHPSRPGKGQDTTSASTEGAGGPVLIGGIDYEGNGHDKVSPTGPLLKGSPTGGGHPLPAVAFAIRADAVRENPLSGQDGEGVQTVFDGNRAAGDQEVAATPNAKGDTGRMGLETEGFVVSSASTTGPGFWKQGEIAGTLRSGEQGSYENSATIRDASTRGREGGATLELGEGLSPAIRVSQGGGDRPMAVSINARQDPDTAEDLVGPLDTDPGTYAITQNSRSEVRLVNGDGQITGALAAEPGAQQQNYIASKSYVRRLTPLECERLQAYPDGYSKIPYKGKTSDLCPDGPRYKALGNSWVTTVARTIGIDLEAAVAYQTKETK